MQVKTTAITLAVLLFIGAAANAQIEQDTVRTWIEATEPETVDNWDGSLITRTSEVRLCYEEGATNPTGRSMTFNVTVNDEVPTWVNVTHAETIMLTPPMGPTQDAGCTEPQILEIELHATDARGDTRGDGTQFDTEAVHEDEDPDRVDTGLERREPTSFTVEVTFTAQDDPDPVTGEPGVGNYDVPDDERVTFEVRTDEHESVPAPAIAVLLLVGALLVATRRRR